MIKTNVFDGKQQKNAKKRIYKHKIVFFTRNVSWSNPTFRDTEKI